MKANVALSLSAFFVLLCRDARRLSLLSLNKQLLAHYSIILMRVHSSPVLLLLLEGGALFLFWLVRLCLIVVHDVATCLAFLTILVLVFLFGKNEYSTVQIVHSFQFQFATLHWDLRNRVDNVCFVLLFSLSTNWWRVAELLRHKSHLRRLSSLLTSIHPAYHRYGKKKAIRREKGWYWSWWPQNLCLFRGGKYIMWKRSCRELELYL